MNDFLPVCRKDMERRGWKQLDFLLITGDAYVDHPTFANGLIARWMEHLGWKIGVVPQPDWRSRQDFEVMGRPRLAAFVSAGNLDSMLNKLTASRSRRASDSYSPGGEVGHRPDRATLVYCNRVREIWGDIPLIIGGIEASMRRFAHYDYWSDTVRRPMLPDARADMLIYGMGELQLKEIALQLDAGVPVGEIDSLPGTCVMKRERPQNCVEIPSYEAVVSDKRSYAEAYRLQSLEQDPFRGRAVAQKVGDRWMVQNRPMRPLTTAEFDLVNELPYTREPHRMYDRLGGIPAAEEVRFSINSTRGCFGSCAFCAIHAHQGRIVQARSEASMVREARELTAHPTFKGYIHDVGGPTGNFRGPSCPDQLVRGCCKNRECLFPSPCPHMKPDHSEFIRLLRKLRALPGVKKVFIRSGLRYDYILADPDGDRFIEELCRYHVSGQLRVAPEHASPKVLRLMGKPPIEEYLRFKERFERATERVGKEQYVLPYLISGHPGCTLKEAVELAEFLRDQKFTPQQVQDFIPTPGSLSTCMFYTGLNPMTGERVYVPRGGREKSMQRALLQYRRPENRALVIEALKRAGREDLIGWGPQCLVRPDKKVSDSREEKRRADTRPLSARGRKKDEFNARKNAR